MVSPDINGIYAPDNHPANSWAPGTNLQFAAQGAAVPAFNVSVLAPAPAPITSPPNGPLTINRAAGITFAWSATQAATVNVELIDQSNVGLVACSFNGGAGMGFVPPAMLSGFVSGQAGVADVYTVEVNTVQAGAWAVQAVGLDLSYENTAVTFQ